MRSSKINYVLVGLFVVGMVAALVVSVALLTGRTGATDNYHTYYSNVTGVKFGTQVVYEGYPIGQVEDVVPEAKDGRMRFRVNFGVVQGWKIPSDSIVEIAAPGLLAALTLSIEAGESSVPLKPGGAIASRERADIFSVVSSVAGQLGDLTENNIKPLLTNVDTAVKTINRIVEKDGESLFRDARKVTENLAGLVDELSRRVPKIADDVEIFATTMRATSAEMQRVVSPANREKMEDAIANIDAASAKVDGLMDSMTTLVEDLRKLLTEDKGDVRQSLSETRYIVESVSRHIDSINQNMEGAARNMYEFTRQIRQNPGLLLGGQAPEDKGAKQ